MSLLNITSAGGPYVRFAPSSDCWIHNGVVVDLKRVVIDHDSVKTGWGLITEGMPPDWSWDAQLGVAGPSPSPNHRRGFSVRMFSVVTGTVEWATNSIGPGRGFEKLFEAIWNARGSNPGKVAVVDYLGSSPLKIGKGDTRVPSFQIVKWVDRGDVPWSSPPVNTSGDMSLKPMPTPVDILADDLPF